MHLDHVFIYALVLKIPAQTVSQFIMPSTVGVKTTNIIYICVGPPHPLAVFIALVY